MKALSALFLIIFFTAAPVWAATNSNFSLTTGNKTISQGALLKSSWSQPAQKSIAPSGSTTASSQFSFSSVFSGLNLSGLNSQQHFSLQSASLSIGVPQSTAIVKQLKTTFTAPGMQSLVTDNPERFARRMGAINSVGLENFTAVSAFLTSSQTGTEHWRDLAQNRPDLFVDSVVDITASGGVDTYKQLCASFDAYAGEGYTAEYLAGGNSLNAVTGARDAGVLDYFSSLESMGATREQIRGVLEKRDVSLFLPGDIGTCLDENGLERVTAMTGDLVKTFGLNEVVGAMQNSALAFFGGVGLGPEIGVFDNAALQEGIPALVSNLVNQGYSQADAEKAVKDTGIFAFSRFESADYRAVLKNCLEADDQRPLAVIIGNKSDHNGAYNNKQEYWGQLLDSGYYRVVYYEVGNEKEFAQALSSATGDGRQPAELIMICGHGEQDSVRFGGKSGSADETLTLDFGDFDELKKQKNVLNDNGSIILISCNTGRFGSEEKNIANMLADVFPQAQMVAGPKHESRLNSLIFDGQGRLEDIQYDLTTRYNAAEEDLDFMKLPKPSGREDYTGGTIQRFQVKKTP
ncbi:MAG TPA: hypothetical protein P5110_04845 [Candidatus Omnitrophota bacterium]|nr:hypothetical protein [Candidatus Omnitrophota bacterium]HRZ14821.1 hypothetical protein [Candidatus Omnitrophota bacterium]